MPYSTHDNLKELHEDIDELTSTITNLSFTGTGPNDLTPKIIPERNIVTSATAVEFRVKITALGTIINTIDWSDDNGSTWTGQSVKITGDDQFLNHGIAIRFQKLSGHIVNDYWEFKLNPPDSNDERIMAYNWVNDKIEPRISVPIAAPSQTLILAEANFAISLILQAKKRNLVADFRNEADRLVNELLNPAAIGGSLGGGSPGGAPEII